MIQKGTEGETFGETVDEQTELNASELAENIREEIGGATITV